MPGMSVPSFHHPRETDEEAKLREELNPTGEDNEAHAGGKICKRCGQVIRADQAARLSGVDDWVHDTCPLVTG
jgi:hypothetical protein